MKRFPQPESLRIHSEEWTRELLEEIKKQGSYAKVQDRYKNKYRQDDIKESLEKMYKKHCCYCESVVGISSYGRIEHLKPKSMPQFYQYTFQWDNLHWCCEICNSSYKRARWDFAFPILDPSRDDIDKFLKLNLTTGKYEAINHSGRARTTIEHTGINRENLVIARRRIMIRFLKDYKAHQNYGDAAEFCKDLDTLKEDLDYPSLYEKLIDSVK